MSNTPTLNSNTPKLNFPLSDDEYFTIPIRNLEEIAYRLQIDYSPPLKEDNRKEIIEKIFNLRSIYQLITEDQVREKWKEYRRNYDMECHETKTLAIGDDVYLKSNAQLVFMPDSVNGRTVHYCFDRVDDLDYLIKSKFNALSQRKLTKEQVLYLKQQRYSEYPQIHTDDFLTEAYAIFGNKSENISNPDDNQLKDKILKLEEYWNSVGLIYHSFIYEFSNDMTSDNYDLFLTHKSINKEIPQDMNRNSAALLTLDIIINYIDEVAGLASVRKVITYNMIREFYIMVKEKLPYELLLQKYGKTYNNPNVKELMWKPKFMTELYYENGNIKTREFYKNGNIKHGSSTGWNVDGSFRYVRIYDNNKLNGVCHSIDHKRNMAIIAEYEKDKINRLYTERDLDDNSIIQRWYSNNLVNGLNFIRNVSKTELKYIYNDRSYFHIFEYPKECEISIENELYDFTVKFNKDNSNVISTTFANKEEMISKVDIDDELNMLTISKFNSGGYRYDRIYQDRLLTQIESKNEEEDLNFGNAYSFIHKGRKIELNKLTVYSGVNSGMKRDDYKLYEWCDLPDGVDPKLVYLPVFDNKMIENQYYYKTNYDDYIDDLLQMSILYKENVLSIVAEGGLPSLNRKLDIYGTILEESTQIDKVQNGITNIYHDNGVLASSMYYLEGKLSGLARTWNKKSILKTLSLWDNDTNVIKITYNKKGEIKTKYINQEYIKVVEPKESQDVDVEPKVDIKDGEYITYREDGDIDEYGVYVNGKPIGKHTKNSTNGVEYTHLYTDKGVPTGSWLDKDDKGRVTVVEYINGKKYGKESTYNEENPNDEIEYIMYDRGMKNGHHIIYDEDSEIKYKCKYKDDKKDGNEVFYITSSMDEYYKHPDYDSDIHGDLAEKVNHWNLGILEYSYIYDSERNVTMTEYYPDGKSIKNIKQYENQGPTDTSYDSNTRKISEINYYESGHLSRKYQLLRDIRYVPTENSEYEVDVEYETKYTPYILPPSYDDVKIFDDRMTKYSQYIPYYGIKMETLFNIDGYIEHAEVFLNDESTMNIKYVNGMINGTISCKNNNINNIKSFKSKQGLIIDNLKEGIHTEHYIVDYVNIIYEIEYKKDIKHGTYKKYAISKDGSKIILKECTYVCGLLHGQMYKRWSNGNIKLEGYWDKGLKSGLFTKYYNNGKISFECKYDMNMKQGPLTKWWSNSRVKQLSNYENDLLVGEYKTWFENGSPLIEDVYENGLSIGVRKQWNEKGDLILYSSYTGHTNSGVYEEYRNGEVICETEYIKHVPVSHINFDTGFELYINEDYTIRNIQRREENNLTSKTTYENNICKTYTRYKNGLKHGTKLFYHSNGHYEKEINYINGLKEGSYKVFDINGVLQLEELYVNDNLDHVEYRVEEVEG